jgi:AraC family transcriptional regulator
MVVTQELQRLGLHVLHAALGEVLIAEEGLSAEKGNELKAALYAAGFELIDDRKGRLIEQIKNLVVQTVHYSDEPPVHKYSEVLSSKLLHEYSYLSKLFSETEGITIEQYIINQKIERVKELIAYNETSLTDIAHQLGYSSVAHLSAQFKSITGMTPTAFKKLHKKQRKPLDEVGRQM